MQKRVVYKLHAGWFINRTLGEFINCGLLLNLKVLSVEILQKEGESLILNFWPPGSLSVQARARDCLPQARGFRTGKNIQHIKHLHCQYNCLACRNHPNSQKNAPRNEWQMKIFHVGSHQFRESLRELLRELWFSYCSSRGMPFREWNLVLREWNFEFRELLREYPGTLQELRMASSLRERFFSEIGVVPSLLKLFLH